jgi:hypothetical protein
MEEREVRSPEWVLDELYDTGRRWMAARARERGAGPSADWGKGDNPPSHVDPLRQEAAAREAMELRDRFLDLSREFMDQLGEL